ncbi:ferritin-like domain-containing protein [Pseudomonas sp. IAC-BECa141]|uniref:ferritin-like domain-containing protein n=1 Tax=Pseudomonas sp. IAC-BECa141 TaxID=2793103 RepID=UPI001D098965|nr:PA2169 family four-helix-bundle protein [Pseudomonas sp. IAC-BECa141]UDI91679.1 PA2169 family four-helix-bundle protein [Pseudomonas sp. IAC-BECa141]
MTDMNKEAISVLNDLIETSKDGQEGFKTCAEDIKHPELKTLFVKRSADCATAAAELQAAVRSMGGDPETSTSVSGDLHRRWVDVKAMFTGKDEEAVLNEAERGEDHALKAYREAIDKLTKIKDHGLTKIFDLVEKQYHGVQRNHDQVKVLRDQARARS